MTELPVVGVIALLAIAGAAVLGPRIGVTAPSLLLTGGAKRALLWSSDIVASASDTANDDD